MTLATAYLEAREYRQTEAVLEEAQKTAWQLTDGVSWAEWLNAWSALHLKLGAFERRRRSCGKPGRLL